MSKLKAQLSKLDRTVLEEHPAADNMLVGQVVETYSPTDRAKANIRWRDAEGQLHERTLTMANGVKVSVGDLVLLQRPSNWPEWLITQLVQTLHAAPAPQAVEVFADGKRVQVEAVDEMILRCGKASITLRSNGRLILHGAYVETHASGTNRIKGGSVLIN